MDLLGLFDVPNEATFLKNESALRAAVGFGRDIDSVGRSHAFDNAARKRYRPRVGLVTILEEEFRAAAFMVDSYKSRVVPGDPHVYLCGTLRRSALVSHNPIDVVIVKQLRMTTPSAATTTTMMMRNFPSIREIILVGIAGAIPRLGNEDKDVALGDVVVSDRAGVFHIDHVAQTAGGPVYRGVMPPPSSGLLGAVDRLVAGADIGSVLLMRMNALRDRDKRFGRPPAETDVLCGSDGKIMRDRGHSTSRLFRGVIASGNALVRDRTVRDKIGQVSGALAIEMEGAGVAEAAWSLGRQYLLVRGLTDYCDDNKSDAWHWYASGIAAATAVSILEYYGG